LIGLVLAAAALVVGGYAVGRSTSWVLRYAHASRATEARAKAMARNSIAHLAVLGPAGQANSIEVVVVGEPGTVPDVEFTGLVTGENGTTFKEGSYVEFRYFHVLSVDA
jgi:hypothetical protein